MKNIISADNFWQKLPELSGDQLELNKHLLDPENRSSAIFPVFLTAEAETRIQFLSYWLKKRGNNIVLRITTRNLLGNVKYQIYQSISEYKSNTILGSKLFESNNNGFCGSIEIEFFSKEKPLYTFPALSLSFANKVSSSVVHTCIRTYNKDERIYDYALYLPQTGFDVDIKVSNKNYICFFGGESNSYKLTIELNENEIKKNYLVNIKNAKYGQTHILYLEDIISKEDRKFFKRPKCSIKHNFNDIFPRFFVGITSPQNIPTLTHTFFDTSKAISDKTDINDLSLRTENKNPNCYFDATFSIPIHPFEHFDTSIKSYSQNIQVKGDGYLSLYSLEGEQLFNRLIKREELSTLCGSGELEISKLIGESKFNKKEFLSLKFSFVNKDNPFPKRFKLGLNVKRINSTYGSNICFSPLIMMDNLINKPFSRRWFPLGGYQKFVASIHNTSFMRKGIQTEATSFLLEFINHNGESFNREKILKQNASIFLDPLHDEQLNKFLGEKGGWCMVTAKTFVFNSYYFSMTETLIGGDHAF